MDAFTDNNVHTTLAHTIHHHVAHAVLGLPFAHIASAKSMPGIDSLQQWHLESINTVTTHLTSLTTHIQKQVGALIVHGNDGTLSKHTASSKHLKTQSQQSTTTNRRGIMKTASISSATGGSSSSTAATSIENSVGPIVCIEFTRGKRRVYRKVPATAAASTSSTASSTSSTSTSSFSVVDDYVTHNTRLRDAAANYLLPQGYPDSVAPQYAKYMAWRGVQYFFGGAMSVFTTRSLLGAVGVANKHSGEAAAAINWVVKDGAGRVGRFLFARWGRELDCELKQFRLGGDILMEAGAALELSTALAPRLFLPLACTANLAKNLAAVAASSTRAPIYRTFARQNNLADITAKGESVANLADVLGTITGIILAKANLPIIPTFAGLSIGYLLASRREVDSVELDYLNRARLSYAARKFMHTGIVPGPEEANIKEPLLPWSDPTGGRIVLGATVAEACSNPAELQSALEAFKGRQYALTYRPETRKVYVMLRQGAGNEIALQGAVNAHAVLHLVNALERTVGSDGSTSNTLGRNGGSIGKLLKQAQKLNSSNSSESKLSSGADIVSFVASNGLSQIYSEFETQAKAGGWRLPLTMLNPSETRVHPV